MAVTTADMGAFIVNVDNIRERTGAHLAAIHHMGKDLTKGMRGTTHLLGAVDSAIRVLDGRITSTDQRDLPDDLNLHFKLKPVTLGIDKKGRPVTSCVAGVMPCGFGTERFPITGAERNVIDAIDACLEDPSKPFGWKDVAGWIAEIESRNAPWPDGDKDLTRQAIYKHLSSLVTKNWIKKGKRGQWIMNVTNLSP
jgi:hypothetical protein